MYRRNGAEGWAFIVIVLVILSGMALAWLLRLAVAGATESGLLSILSAVRVTSPLEVQCT